MDNKKQDYIKEYDDIKAKYKPTALLSVLALIAVLVVLPILFFTIHITMTILGNFLIVCSIIILVSIPAWWKLSKCPACKKFLGRDIGKHCSSCGVQIQE